MAEVYRALGVRTIINAAGTLTRLGGCRMRPEVVAAMAEAATALVRIDELQAAAGAVIARHTGAEAGYVTNGAAGGLVMAAAACLAGLDPARMDRLPDARGMPNEIVIARSHRSGYCHALRAAGARLVEVGMPDPEPWELDDAIGPDTAAVAFSAGYSDLDLGMVCRVAHARGVPVIVDAAAELPPASNLRAFVAAEADLVSFSGGKALGGPQASGILCGRRDLIASAALQHWDQDVLWDLFDPPPALIPRERLAGVPRHGIARSCKVGKEEIVGLIAALERYAAEDHDAAMRAWDGLARSVAEGLAGLPGVSVELYRKPSGVPRVRLAWIGADAGARALATARALKDGEPSVHLVENDAPRGRLAVDPLNLTPAEAEAVVRRLREVAR